MDPSLASEENILDKRVKGITIRVVTAIIISTCTLVISGMTGYQGIVDAIRNENTTNKIQDMQIKDMQIRLDKLQMDVDYLKQANAKKYMIYEK